MVCCTDSMSFCSLFYCHKMYYNSLNLLIARDFNILLFYTVFTTYLQTRVTRLLLVRIKFKYFLTRIAMVFSGTGISRLTNSISPSLTEFMHVLQLGTYTELRLPFVSLRGCVLCTFRLRLSIPCRSTLRPI
ncbi:unnamed protein product [Spodoptera littoralis]|uniref:Uncharacterized protein n=1 Tax=Spodoptera littoralis TaxID=7109 RepID=A0A9P0N4U4_SPOLI|nr:unnamed protein product [Spodoptera littoralis]CAH1644897.1 unnamed protein product [Spodoptera littoralis]